MIREYIGDAAMWGQLAEEATELAHAALKMERIIRGENPTPLRAEDAAMQVEEEWTDLILCGMELQLNPDPKVIYQKQKRFVERAQEAEMKRMKEHTNK